MICTMRARQIAPWAAVFLTVSGLGFAAVLDALSPGYGEGALAAAGWISYEPGRGARLTEPGIAEARRVIRRHRLVELFLTRVLGLDWSEVDADAEALEFLQSQTMTEADLAEVEQVYAEAEAATASVGGVAGNPED